LKWFKNYNFSILRIDFISGLTVALVLIPQSMAYAQLAGLPPYYGLYAAFLPPLIAALFGSSNQLATGPVAVVSLMTATALEPLATAGSESFIAYAILLALFVGIFQLLLGVLKLGLVVNLLSHPVVNGFTSAAALIIATSQLSKIFGVQVDKAEHHYQTVYQVVEAALTHTHWPTLAIASLAFGIMILVKWYNRRLPGVLIAVIITTVISWAIGFEHNVRVDISQVKHPETTEKISKFNANLARIDSLVEQRVWLNAEIHKTEKIAGSHSIEVLSLKHQVNLINTKTKSSKEDACEYRYELRKLKFKAILDDNGKLAFYENSEFPMNAKSEDYDWHLKIGNSRLKETDLVFLGGGDVVGNIPAGLPEFKIPRFQLSEVFSLFPMAIIISLLGFMEAISIAKAMAAKTGQRLDPNQELVGQGLANIIGSCTGSYAVSGSFSRSAVNIQAGARTGLSSVFSSGIVSITLLFFTTSVLSSPGRTCSNYHDGSYWSGKYQGIHSRLESPKV